MCGRRTDPALLLALALFTGIPAWAKKSTFDNRSGIGFTLRGGATAAPEMDFAARPQSSARGYAVLAGIDPFVDFGNFVIRGQAAVVLPPDVQGTGGSGTGAFGDKAESTVLLYGGQLQLIPWISQARTSRIYLAGGLGLATIYVTQTRTYTGGATSVSYTAKARTTRPYTTGAMGLEAFLVQNYVLQIEGGYRDLHAHELHYTTSGDARGATPGTGAVARDDQGTPQAYGFSGLYASVAFSLVF
ncbi:MAG: hypothetical protein HUU37_06935 [Bdellovibrionales bacterium]|nr:hypothetical protein [Bdellovibrionales bacterium]